MIHAKKKTELLKYIILYTKLYKNVIIILIIFSKNAIIFSNKKMILLIIQFFCILADIYADAGYCR